MSIPATLPDAPLYHPGELRQPEQFDLPCPKLDDATNAVLYALAHGTFQSGHQFVLHQMFMGITGASLHETCDLVEAIRGDYRLTEGEAP